MAVAMNIVARRLRACHGIASGDSECYCAQAADEIERLTADKIKLAEENLQLRQLIDGYMRGGQPEIEQLQAAIAYVRQRSQRACEILNEFDNTRAALENKP